MGERGKMISGVDVREESLRVPDVASKKVRERERERERRWKREDDE